MSIRVLLADDHHIVLDGVHAVLEENEDIEIIGKATTGKQAVQMSREQQPDILVMDITMPDISGIEAARHITTEHPAIKVLCLSMHADRGFVMAALEAGASGYVLKDAAKAELHRAICAVMVGQIYLSPVIAGQVVDAARSRAVVNAVSGVSLLTDREREVLQLLAQGETSKQLAHRLHLSVKTVGTHRRNIMRKLNIDNIAGLTKFAIRENMISVEA